MCHNSCRCIFESKFLVCGRVYTRMAQAGTGGPPGAADDGQGRPEVANVAAAVVRGLTAVVVAGPVMGNLAGALVPPGPLLPPRFDVGVALQGPTPTKSNISFEIYAWIDDS